MGVIEGAVDVRAVAGAPASGTDEIQQVTITGTPTGGTFRLLCEGFLTGALAYNTSAGTLQAAYEALPCIGAGNVEANGGPLPGTAITVHFRNARGRQSLPVVSVAATALTGGTNPAVAVTRLTAGEEATGRGASKGALLIDTQNQQLYINTGTPESPNWATSDKKRREMVFSPNLLPPDNQNVQYYRHFSTSGREGDSEWLAVPFGENRWAVFGFDNYGGTVGQNTGRIWEARCGINTVWDDGAVTTNGTWTATTVATEVYGGDTGYATVNTAYKEASVTGSDLFIRHPLRSNSGLARVSIDGSFTAATSLPAFTQADVDSGLVTSGELGHRYINMETPGGGDWNDCVTLIAEGLTDAAHTVRLVPLGKFADGSILIAHGTVTGTYIVGETITQASTGATATLISDTASAMRVNVVSGTFSSSASTLTGGTSGATSTNSAVGARGYITAFIGASATTKPTDSNATFVPLRRITDPFENVGVQIDAAIEFKPTGAVNYQFAGGSHGNETLILSAVYSDNGTLVDDFSGTRPASGSFTSSKRFYWVRDFYLTHPEVGGNHIRKRVTWEFACFDGRPDQFRCHVRLYFLTGGTVRGNYAGMFTVGQQRYNGPRQKYYVDAFDQVWLGDTKVPIVNRHDDNTYGSVKTDFAVFAHTSHDVMAAILQYDPQTAMNGYQYAGSGNGLYYGYVYFKDKTDGPKVYFNRSGPTTEPVVPGQIMEWTHGYRIWRKRNAAAWLNAPS